MVEECIEELDELVTRFDLYRPSGNLLPLCYRMVMQVMLSFIQELIELLICGPIFSLNPAPLYGTAHKENTSQRRLRRCSTSFSPAIVLI